MRKILNAADRMQRLQRELLAFARLGRAAVAIQPVDLTALVDECLDGLEREIAARGAHVAIAGALPTVPADPALLKIALTNLIGNALKYVPPGNQPRIVIAAARNGAGYRIAVRDNGIGIPPEGLARLFTPFARLHSRDAYDGVGLGLSTVRKVVELMGGRVEVESELNGCSTFSIELREQDQACE